MKFEPYRRTEEPKPKAKGAIVQHFIIAILIFALSGTLVHLSHAVGKAKDDAILGYSFWDLMRAKDPPPELKKKDPIQLTAQAPLSPSEIPTLSALKEESTKVISRVLPSVVSISSEHLVLRPYIFPYSIAEMVPSAGSGAIISTDGYVVTNNHVIEGAKEVYVTLSDGRKLPAEIYGTHPTLDVAVLKITPPDDIEFQPLPLGDSNSVRVAEPVFAIGNPFGQQNTVTSGIISAIGRGGNTDATEKGWLQTDTVINPGNSGGPLINTNGEIIGINVSILNADQSRTWQGVGFAIPSNDVKRAIDIISGKETPKQGYLGISYSPAYGGGVQIASVIPQSPAEAAGLQASDIIFAINDEPIQNIQDLSERIGVMPVGKKVTLGIVRKQEKMQIQATIAERDEKTNALLATLPQTPNTTEVLGLSVRQLTDSQKVNIGLQATDPALLVMDVGRDSPFYNHVRPGDLVHGVNQQATPTVAALHQRIEDAIKNSARCILHTSRNGQQRTLIHDF